MTTEQVPSPPAGFDTRAEANALIEAGLPEKQAAAVLDTGLRAADARFAMLAEEMKRDREDRARDHAALVEELRSDREDRARDHAALREEMKRERGDRARDHAALREEMKREREDRARDSAALRRDMKRDKADLRREIRHMSTQLQLRGSLAVGGGVLATVTILRFLMNTG